MPSFIIKKNKVCQQTILMKYHALFVIFEKQGYSKLCGLLQIIGGTLHLI